MGERKRITKKELEQRLKELTLLLKRVQADFENYKKRVEREKIEAARYACTSFITKLLPVVDSFEQAINTCSDEGIKMIYSQLMDVLCKEGLRRIECIGKTFDPYLHEALLHVVSDKKPGTIIEELQCGFMFDDMVLRHAKVKVAKENENKKKDTIKGSA